MKKCLCALFLALIFILPIKAWAYNNGLIREQTVYTEDSTSAIVTLLPTSPNVAYTVFGFDLAVSSADNIYLECGSTKMAGYFLAATSGIVRTYYPLFWQCPVGTAVNLVKGTATTPVRILLFYSKDNY